MADSGSAPTTSYSSSSTTSSSGGGGSLSVLHHTLAQHLQQFRVQLAATHESQAVLQAAIDLLQAELAAAAAVGVGPADDAEAGERLARLRERLHRLNERATEVERRVDGMRGQLGGLRHNRSV